VTSSPLPPAPPKEPADPVHQALGRGMLLAALFAAIAGVARVVQDGSIAWRHGTGPEVDAYYFMLALAGWPVAVALSTLTLLAAPAEARARRDGPAQVQLLRGRWLGGMLLIALASAPLAWWALRTVAAHPWSGLEPAAAGVAVAASTPFALLVPMGLVAALLSAWLVSGARHVVTLLEAVPPLVLAGLLVSSSGLVLYWGTAVGVALQAVAMALVLHAQRGLPRPRLAGAGSGVLPHGLLALLSGQALFALMPLADPWFAAHLGEGLVAILGYANRLVLGLQGLAGLALQRAGLPLLAELAAASPERARAVAVRWAAAAAGAGALLGLVVAGLAEPLVALLLQRGRFSAADAQQVAGLLRWGMLQMPPFLAGVALVTALAASSAHRAVAVAAGVGLVCKLALNVALVGSLGVRGLLLATALMYTVTAAFTWVALAGLGRRGR
jgi:putative peptidoglycan lipid II flippase